MCYEESGIANKTAAKKMDQGQYKSTAVSSFSLYKVLIKAFMNI